MEKMCGDNNDKSLYFVFFYVRNFGCKWIIIMIYLEILNIIVFEDEIYFRSFLFKGMLIRG